MRTLSLKILNHVPNIGVWIQDVGDYFSLFHWRALTCVDRACSLFIVVGANSAAMRDVTSKAML